MDLGTLQNGVFFLCFWFFFLVVSLFKVTTRNLGSNSIKDEPPMGSLVFAELGEDHDRFAHPHRAGGLGYRHLQLGPAAPADPRPLRVQVPRGPQSGGGRVRLLGGFGGLWGALRGGFAGGLWGALRGGFGGLWGALRGFFFWGGTKGKPPIFGVPRPLQIDTYPCIRDEAFVAATGKLQLKEDGANLLPHHFSHSHYVVCLVNGNGAV